MSDADALLPPMAWNAWGDPALAKPLSAGIRSLLEQALGITPDEAPGPGIAEVALTPSALPEPHRDALAAVVGEEYLRTEDRDRLLHAGGKSTPDLLRRRQSQQEAPDAVLLPGTDEEVSAILDYCGRHRIAVVPFGGGTSVVGGLDPVRLDLVPKVSIRESPLDETSVPLGKLGRQ